MKRHNLQQGSPEWLAFRREHFTASDAPAMLGVSPYKTRAQLLAEKATGIRPEVDAFTQRCFDEGHRLEALARPFAEAVCFAELFPVTGSNCELAASFDGLTMEGDIVWEHKTLNNALRQILPYAYLNEGAGEALPEHYRAQLEQQLIVSGASKALFMAGELNTAGQYEGRYCWYESNPAMRQRILDGWQQFMAELQNWKPEAAPAIVTPAEVEALPVPVVTVSGSLAVSSNLHAFGQTLKAFVHGIPAKPETDQEFADCEDACKRLKKAEEALTAAEEHALAQVSGIEQMRRTVGELKNIARTARLATEKLVKAEKDARRAALVMQARQDWQACADELAAGLRGIAIGGSAPDFATAIKGLSSFESISNKLQAALLEGKSLLQARAAQIGQSLQVIDAVPAQFRALIPDWQELAKKDAQTLGLLIDERIRQHGQAQSAAAQSATPAQAESPATADAPPAPAPAESAADEAAALKLGDINTRLYPLHITADILRKLGIEPAAKERAATLYKPSQWPAIKAAIINHIRQLP